jgi:hypothetical protein
MSLKLGGTYRLPAMLFFLLISKNVSLRGNGVKNVPIEGTNCDSLEISGTPL